MKICHYNEHEAGAIEGERVFPVGAALVAAGHLRQGYTMQEVIERLANEPAAMQCARQALKGRSAPLAQAKLLAPIENPPSLWAAAANYRAHQAEMRAASGGPDRADFSKDDLMAEFFLKPSSSIIGPGGTIVLPRIAQHVDYECELCAVIGRKSRHVSEAQALDQVFGYTICWDISQREPWGRNRQNTRNIRKGFDSFTALGPWIVTRDELPEPQDTRIDVELNGRHVMTAHTKDMICGVRDHIRFLSSVLTLRPGDLITTGTPAGVAKLAPGDKLKGRIEGVGEMTLSVSAEE
ncbi:MAG TPA: fumarylacetoacetate hydrolase family protein [Burkholderiales bacterium]|jgi:2-keto-4-pentenoate hydratase/2-oxohepta-3-ene-1,7-dioic acid hydratase in catechol pathway|nr:fumarylacetoacetate hydrolase family protein [Burkholderiales bacterium]